MLKLKANGKHKELKDEFIDVTLNELADAYAYVSGLAPDLKRYLLSDNEEDINKEKFFEFKLEWVARFSDFSVDDLRLIPIDAPDSLSVDWLYGHCKKFLYQPESYLELKEFKHKGKKYTLMESLKTIGGAELLFGNGNYRQFMIGSQLTNMVEENRNQGGIPSLIQLFAV